MSPEPSFLATRRGKLTLAFLCGVAFLDFVDASIVNVALPSIRHRPALLASRACSGCSAAICSPTAASCSSGAAPPTWSGGGESSSRAPRCSGLARWRPAWPETRDAVGARLAQGVGAAMMIPAALSILTTTFSEPAIAHGARRVGRDGGLARRPACCSVACCPTTWAGVGCSS